MSGAKPYRTSAVLLLLAATGVATAEGDGTDFLLNVFSDIGPILALFGEEFARQFLSESFTFYDHLVFACIPLGIMAAISGAIRVQGPKFARAFIGRARENRAAAEIQYMSSTSGEVCELFNGLGIVRIMGRPDIAQFLIFPHEMDQHETHGIHTLQTAVKSGIMTKRRYNENEKVEPSGATNHDIEGGGTSVRLNGSTSSHPTANLVQHDETENADDFAFLESPNLQLNIPSEGMSPNDRQYELRIAAAIAVTLQISLLVIAGVISHHSSNYGNEPWGLPCYLSGSVLLFLGMLACSAAIEQSTVEFEWRPQKDHEKPNIAWIQRQQRVSDQKFEPYIIYTNSMSHVLTSSRSEDVKGYQKRVQPAESGGHEQRRPATTRLSRVLQRLSFNSSQNPDDAKVQQSEVTSDSSREGLALFGAFSGGIGFTVQFIGLRGLPWPCGVAHLVAIFLMALIRAAVRRRLGDKPRNHGVPVGFELDYLATRLAESEGNLIDKPHEQSTKGGRGSNAQPDMNNDPNKGAKVETIMCWKVETAEKTKLFKFQDNMSHAKNPSQQLVCLRERLGKLCRWKSNTFKSAVALALSIDRFMNDFVGELPGTKVIDWVFPCIRTIKTEESGKFNDEDVPETVRISITWGTDEVKDNDVSKTTRIDARGATDKINPKSKKARWIIASKTVEATLSLWVAHLETKVTKEVNEEKRYEQTPLMSTTTQKVDYCRIIGESGKKVRLIRDIESWVRNPTVSEIEAERQPDDLEHEHENVKIFIGFIGPSKGAKDQKLLAQHSSGDLATIAAQHLFTNFMWTIAKHIPRDVLHIGNVNVHEFVKVQSSGTLDSQPTIELGSGQKLSHSKLTKFVTTCEKEGLGALDDILLCMIPALSSRDILPNDIILKGYLPKERPLEDPQRKKKLCRDYNHCLDSVTVYEGDEVQDYLTLSAIVDALELVYLMAIDLKSMKLHQSRNENETDVTGGTGGSDEQTPDPIHDRSLDDSVPDDEYSEDNSEDEGSSEADNSFCVDDAVSKEDLGGRIDSTTSEDTASHADKSMLPRELDQLLAKISERFSSIVQKLSPFYDLQGRSDPFVEIFKLYLGEDGATLFSSRRSLLRNGQISVEFMDHIGFGQCHRKVWNDQEAHEITLKQLLDNDKRDIFGWTVFHYAAARSDLTIKEMRPEESGEILAKMIDASGCLNKYQQSPIHIAASCGNTNFLHLLQREIPEERLKPAAYSGGLDGMTPMHLAMDGNYASCVQVLSTIMANDALVMVDAWKRHYVHVAALRQSNECLSKLSEISKLKFRPERLDKFGNTPLSYLHRENESQQKFAKKLIFQWEGLDVKDEEGNTVLHHSVRFLSEGQLESLFGHHNQSLKVNERNRSGHTPLYLATFLKKESLVKVLLNQDADPFTKNSLGKGEVPPIVLACQLAQVRIVNLMLEKRRISNETEKEGKRALPHAIKAQCGSENDRKEIVQAIAKAMDNIDVKEPNGRNALHEAVIKGQDALVSILLDNKASPKIKDSDGCNALHHAVGLSNTATCLRIMEKLLKAMPDCVDQQDNSGNTPLHLAVDQMKDKIAISLSGRANLDIQNHDGKSPLMLACRDGTCLEFIEHVINSVNQKTLATDINEGDSEYAETALAWACEFERLEAVTRLLKATSLDPNTISKWRGRTPLHFALYEKEAMIVKALLDDPRVRQSLDIPDESGRRPAYYAINLSDTKCLKEVLSNSNAGPELFSDSELKILTEHGDSEIEDIAWDALVRRLLLGPEHQSAVQFPLHELAETGRYQKIKNLVDENQLNIGLDADNWTPSDIAESHGHTQLAEYLRKKESEVIVSRPPYREPSNFINVYEGTGMDYAPCNLHENCGRMLLDAEIHHRDVMSDESCYLRTQESIAPNLDNFYFEVEIIKTARNKFLGIGFCDSNIGPKTMPGWDRGSWAYHGDDGGLFVEAGRNKVSNASCRTFDEGDVVGCGFNFKTREGYRTLNGTLLDSENAFQDNGLARGKLYPCIAFRSDNAADSIKVHVSLKNLQEHPFRYQGPYDGGIEEANNPSTTEAE